MWLSIQALTIQWVEAVLCSVAKRQYSGDNSVIAATNYLYCDHRLVSEEQYPVI